MLSQNCIRREAKEDNNMTRYRINNSSSRKCVVIGQTSFYMAMVAMIILVGCIACVSRETIFIDYITGNGQPEEGDSNYQLQCLITHLDDNLLFWSTGTAITDLDMTGDYTIQESYSNPITSFILTFTQVRYHHSGNYKCFTATGDTHNFNVIQSSAVSITVTTGPFTPSVTDAPRPIHYFPSSEWPKCYPQNDVKALIYSQIDIKCVSTPGNPMVEVNIYVPSNGQVIPNSDSIINKTNNRIERIDTYQVIPTDNMDQFLCQIIDGNGMNRQCTMGSIGIGLFQYDHIPVNQGDNAIFQCLARNAIHCLTEPPIDPSRLEMTGDVLLINNLMMVDNGTKVICRVDGYNLQDQAILIVIPHNTHTAGSTGEPSSQATVSLKPLSWETLPPTFSPTDTYSPSSIGTAAPSNMIGLFVGVCIGLNVITFVTGMIVGVLCYRKKLHRDIKHEKDTIANTRDSTINSDQVHSRSDPKDSANRNVNLTNITDHSPRVAPATTQSSDESYTDLQLTDVHRSQYAILKKPEVVGSNRDYVNVNPRRDQEPVYEVHIESRTNNM